MAARHRVWQVVAASLSVGSGCPRTLLVHRHTGFVRVQGSRFLSSVSRDVVSSEEKRKEVVAATTGLTQGDKFGMDRCFTSADLSAYVKLCGDTNPIHSCESTAQSAGFRGRVVHGMLYAGLFPAIIGSQFVRTWSLLEFQNWELKVKSNSHIIVWLTFWSSKCSSKCGTPEIGRSCLCLPITAV